MPLSPKDVEQKTFTASFRGYAEDEVDSFLEEVIASIEAYQQMIRERDARIAQLEAGHVMAPIGLRSDAADAVADEEFEAPQAPPPVAPAPVIDESAVSRALIVAQRTADQLVGEANVEADRIVDRARRQATELDAEQAAYRQSVVDGYLRLRGELAGLRGRVNDSLGVTESTFRSLEAEVEDLLARERSDRATNPSEVEEAHIGQHLAEDVDDHEDRVPGSEPDIGESTDRRPWER